MDVCAQHHQRNANAAPARVFTRRATWHLGSTMEIPTVGTGFKPYGVRPKERLS